MRNAVDGVLGEIRPEAPLTKTWLLDLDILRLEGLKRVITAIQRMERGKPITRGRVVAGLPFAFWAGLFGRPYEELWRHRLRYMFSIAGWIDPAARVWLEAQGDALAVARAKPAVLPPPSPWSSATARR